MRLWYLPFFLITFFWMKLKARRIYKKVKYKNIDITDEDRYKVVLKIIKRFLFFSKIKLKVEGMDNLNLKKNYLIVANHQSNYDSLMILQILKGTTSGIIAKHELLRDFKINSFLKILYVFPIKRDNLRQSLDIMDKAREFMIQRKNNLLIFPEGTRSKSEVVNNFKPGAFKIAKQTHYPILPIAISNSYQINRNIFRGNIVVKINILKPILSSSFQNVETAKLASKVQELITNKITEIAKN